VAGLVGTPYVVNFWASWCTECVEEVPYLQEVADVAAGRFQVLGVNFLDAEEGALLAAPDFGLRYPSLFDPEGKLGEAFPVPGLPVTFFVDTDGSIVGTQTGPFDSADDLRDAIEQELGVRL
jgi:thiol-disulfide isomerase/thioredoxin